MGTLTVSAVSLAKLPSELQFMGWIDDWRDAHGGTWTLGPEREGPSPTTPATRPVTFADTTSSPNASIDKSLETYNETHHGNDMITWAIN